MILDKFTIQTQDSVAIARDKLARQIEATPSPLDLRSNRVRFCGAVSEDTFMLYRIDGGGEPRTTINGYFETVPLGTIVYLEVKLNLKLVLVHLLLCLSFITVAWHGIKDVQIMCAVIRSITILAIVTFIYSYRDEMRFYRKKLPQVFL
jgi:hypothetical protein